MTTQPEPLYRILADLAQAYQNCKASANDWMALHEERAHLLVKEFLPSGSGWDLGTRFMIETSNGEKLIFMGAFHHMNDAGMYDGWTDHTITVTGSLFSGINLKISGRNRRDIKDHLHECFETALKETISRDRLMAIYAAASLTVRS